METNNIYDMKLNLDTKSGRYFLMFEIGRSTGKKDRRQHKPRAWVRYHYGTSVPELIDTLPALSTIGETRLMSTKKILLTDDKLKFKVSNLPLVRDMFFSDFDLYSSDIVRFTPQGRDVIKSYLDRYNGLDRIFLPEEVNNIKDTIRQQLNELKEREKADKLDIEIFITHIIHLIKYRKPMGE